jgi:hypothetical protein
VSEPDTLSTLTFTARERVLLARALTIVAAMADALGDDTKALLQLWERVQPDEVGA